MMQSPYDPALRAEIRQRMSPPNRESVAEIARSTGVNSQTLYSWRHRWKQEGQLADATASMTIALPRSTIDSVIRLRSSSENRWRK